MLNTSEILTKTLSTLIVGAVVGAATLAYNSISEKLDAFNEVIEAHPNLTHELEELDKTKVEMEVEYKRFRKRVNQRLEKDSTDIKYTRGWVDYWVSVRAWE